ncbi:DNA-directed RNA polymerase subunit omega [Dirofilaria immitis]
MNEKKILPVELPELNSAVNQRAQMIRWKQRYKAGNALLEHYDDQREIGKRIENLLYYKEIITWLQNPEARKVFYDGTDEIGE